MRMELIIRFDYGAVVPWVRRDRRRACARSPARTRCVLRTPVPTARRGPDAPSPTFTVARGRARCRSCSPGIRRTSRRPTPRRRRARRSSDTDDVVARVVPAAARYDGRVARRRRALADHAQGADLRADRRHRRGADDVAARAASAACATGTTASAGCATRRSRCYALLQRAATPTRRAAWRDWLLRAVAGDPARAADHVRRRPASGGCPSSSSTGCPATRARAPVRIGNAARRAVPARRLRRGDGRAAPGRAAPGIEPTSRRLGARSARCSTSSRARWREPGRGHLGGARPAPALHALEGDGVGRVRPRGQGGRAARAAPGRSTAGARCATRSTREVCAQGFDAERGTFTQSYGSQALDASAAADPAGRLPAARRPARASARSRRSSAS